MPKVTMSTPIAMNADSLWQAIGSFASIGQWHPMMERVDSDGESKGSLRTLRLIGGAKLVERLDAAISGNNADPIHVSTGLFVQPIQANGESRGKKYDRIATGLQYDHLAILLNERGAGTPSARNSG